MLHARRWYAALLLAMPMMLFAPAAQAAPASPPGYAYGQHCTVYKLPYLFHPSDLKDLNRAVRVCYRTVAR